MRIIKHYKYKNLTLVIIGLLITIIVSRLEFFNKFVFLLGDFGYAGAILGGLLFVSTFTVGVGAIILVDLAKYMSPWEIGLFAGMGAVLGDYFIFKLVRDNLGGEINSIYKKVDSKHHLVKLFHTRYFRWSLPVIGAIIIASPLPDEIGVSLMGISKMKSIIFLPISFLLNSIGIFLVIYFLF